MLRCAPEDEKQRSKRCKWPVEISQDSTITLRGNQQGCWFLPGKKCLGQTLSNRLIFREWDAEMLQVWLCLGSRWCIMDDLIFSSDFFTSLYVHQNALAIIRYSAFEYDHRAGFFKNKKFLPLWCSMLTLKKICAGCQRVTPFTENKASFSTCQDDKMIRWVYRCRRVMTGVSLYECFLWGCGSWIVDGGKN